MRLPFLIGVLVSLTTALPAFEMSLRPDPGAGPVTVIPTVTYNVFDRYKAGDRTVVLPGKVHQEVATLYGAYSWPDLRLMADLQIGYARVHGSLGDDRGLNDTTTGLTWRIGGPWRLKTRIGAIIPGTYEVLGPQSLGVGAAGGEWSVLAGHRLNDAGLALDAEIGLRVLSEQAPNRLLGSVHLSQPIDALRVAVGYRRDQSLSGGDAGEVDDQAIRRIAGFAEAVVTWQFVDGTSVGVFAAQVVDGRNKPDKTILGVTGTVGF